MAASIAIFGACVTLWQIGKTPQQDTRVAEFSEYAQERYLQGLYHFNLRTNDGLRTAIDLFSEAREAEPAFADAHAALAQAYNLASQYGVHTPQTGYEAARRAAEQALAIEPEHPGALAALAFNTFYWARDFTTAYELFEKALRREPGNADVHHWYALATMHDRRFDIAIREIDRAQKLAPGSPGILANKGLILHHAGRSSEALALLEPLARSQPALLSAASYLATVYLDTGDDIRFIAAFRRAAEIMDSDARRQVARAADEGFATGGRQGMLAAMFDAQRKLHAKGEEQSFRLALTASHMGDCGMAVDYLQEAIERQEPGVLGIRLELARAVMDAVPRYQDLVKQVGFSTD